MRTSKAKIMKLLSLVAGGQQTVLKSYGGCLDVRTVGEFSSSLRTCGMGLGRGAVFCSKSLVLDVHVGCEDCICLVFGELDDFSDGPGTYSEG